MDVQRLKNMTFGMLCQELLGPVNYYKLCQSFGYDAEFQLINAYDGLEMFKSDFANDTKYVSCVEGLGEWVDRIVTAITESGNASVYLEHTVLSWKRGMSVIVRNTKGQTLHVHAKAVVYAIPKHDLQEASEWNSYQRSMIDSVEEVPLHRIYGRFPAPKQKPWFHELPKTSTNADIRQFIPISKSKGIAMVSYSDTGKAAAWHQAAYMGEKVLRSALLQQLHVVFPEFPKIPSPTWIQSHYWSAGVHMWKPGADSEKVSDAMIQPYGADTPLYVVGECYSKHQAWIEGALETVDRMLPRLKDWLASFAKKKGGDVPSIVKYAKQKRHGVLTQKDLSYMQTNFPDEVWVVLRDPRDKRKKVVLVVHSLSRATCTRT
jgi:hypothetical protein